MSLPSRREAHEARSRAALRPAPVALIRWPLSVLLAVGVGIPLFVLLCGPMLYNLLAPYPILPTSEAQLQEVAALLDDIYTTLANMTFIPATAIKRGPHNINTTAIPCQRDSSVLRLMEIMPYVDRFEVKEHGEVSRTDWLYGGEFIDYRLLEHLIEGCDPVRSENTWFHTGPNMVALTSWGSGGWNGDATHVLVYDTARNAIGVWDGEDWIRLYDQDDPGHAYYDHTGVGLFNHSITANLAVGRDGWQWEIWFDAPTLLRRMLHAYQFIAWTPWETSNREDGWGVTDDVVKELLRKNGWPHIFEGDQFNADFIRAKHTPTGRGLAEDVLNTIEELQGKPEEEGKYHAIGRIPQTKQDIERLERLIEKETDENTRWYWVYRAQSDRWNLARDEADLEEAKITVERLCPGGLCVKDVDLILWEFFSLGKEYKKAQDRLPPEKSCESDLKDMAGRLPNSPERYNNCVAKRHREAHWLQLAYTQSEADALTRGTLLPRPSLIDRANTEIKKMEQQITRAKAQALEMYAWLPTLPENAEWARTEFERAASAMQNWPWNIKATIEWYEQQLADGGDKVRLERCLDDGDCVWGEV
jgi:hypothetical protein